VRSAHGSERSREGEERAPGEVLLAQVDRRSPGWDAGERGCDTDRQIRCDPAVRDEVDNGDGHP
jgi:hypothetical protein